MNSELNIFNSAVDQKQGVNYEDLMQIADPEKLKALIEQELRTNSVSEDAVNRILAAIKTAEKVHVNQKRLEGTPYILHPLRVMLSLIKDGSLDVDVMTVAVLHDAIEDASDLDALELRNNLSQEIVDDILVLSRYVNGVKKSDADYYEQIGLAKDVLKKIKVYDRIDNLYSLSSIDDQARKKRYVGDTRSHFSGIAAGNSELEKKLEEAINSVKI